VEQAALQRQPGATSALSNGQRRQPTKAGKRSAKLPCEGGLRGNEDSHRHTVGGDTRADEEMRRWAHNLAGKAKRHVDAFRAREEEVHVSDDDYSGSELVGQDADIDPVAALVIA